MRNWQEWKLRGRLIRRRRKKMTRTTVDVKTNATTVRQKIRIRKK